MVKREPARRGGFGRPRKKAPPGMLETLSPAAIVTVVLGVAVMLGAVWLLRRLGVSQMVFLGVYAGILVVVYLVFRKVQRW